MSKMQSKAEDRAMTPEVRPARAPLMSDQRDKVMSDLDDVVRSEQTGNRWVMSAAQAALDEIASLRKNHQRGQERFQELDAEIASLRARLAEAQEANLANIAFAKDQVAQLASARKALEWVRDQRWDENADLDTICTHAERALTDEKGPS